MPRSLFYFFLIVFLPTWMLAQTAADTLTLPEDDLVSLLNTPVAVASVQEMTVSESPAILSVITKEDIIRYGLQDLSDIRFIIPGIDFGCDVLGVVGMGIRNNWAHEGKVLVLLDGIDLSERLYSNTPFGSRFPLDNIEKIEILRGPGSVLYGGNAALMVINMISDQTEKKGTLKMGVSMSHTGNRLAQRGGFLSLAAGNARSGYSVFSRFARDIRSDRIYTDVNGNSFNMANHSEIEDAAFYFNGWLRGWGLSVLYDDYNLQSKDGYIDITENTNLIRFKSLSTKLKKSLKPNRNLEITPFIKFKNQMPWTVIYENKSENPDEIIHLNKVEGGTHLTWLMTEYHSLAAGVEGWAEEAFSPEGSKQYFEETNHRFAHHNFSAFMQTTSRLRYWSFSPGIRFNYSSRHFSAFVPRLAITRNWNWGYSKAIASRSYRTPSIMNMAASSSIKPEFASVFEIETGFAFRAFSVLSVNVYQMTISNPIVYYYDEATSEDSYINDDKAGTEGIELTFNHHFPRAKIILSASVSRPVSTLSHQLYQVEGHPHYLLGFSPYQFSVNYAYPVSSRTSVWSLFTFNGKKFGITSLDEQGEPQFSAFKENFLINAGISHGIDKASRWTITASINNLLNQQVYYIQPYKSYHGALPGKGRELSLRLSYNVKL